METLPFIYFWKCKDYAENLPFFDRSNGTGEFNSFLRSVALQYGNSLLTGPESRVTIKTHFKCESLHKLLVIDYLATFVIQNKSQPVIR